MSLTELRQWQQKHKITVTEDRGLPINWLIIAIVKIKNRRITEKTTQPRKTKGNTINHSASKLGFGSFGKRNLWYLLLVLANINT